MDLLLLLLKDRVWLMQHLSPENDMFYAPGFQGMRVLKGKHSLKEERNCSA